MKKILLILAIVGLVSGCAFINKQKANAEACWNDTDCQAKAIAKAKANGETAGNLASLSGIPAAATVAKPVVSYISLLVFLCTLGSAITSNRKPVVPA